MIYSSGDVFQGKFIQGKRHGPGVWTHKRHAAFEEDPSTVAEFQAVFSNGHIDGHVTATLVSGYKYRGESMDGVPHGKGQLAAPMEGAQQQFSPFVYEGEFEQGLPHGAGTLRYRPADAPTLQSTNEFIGNFWRGRRKGQGMLRTFDQTSYEGEWDGGRLVGPATVAFANGDRFQGTLPDDPSHRSAPMSGVFTFASRSGPYGPDVYDGEFLDGAFHGKGKYSWGHDGARFSGLFLHGLKISGDITRADGAVECYERRSPTDLPPPTIIHVGYNTVTLRLPPDLPDPDGRFLVAVEMQGPEAIWTPIFQSTFLDSATTCSALIQTRRLTTGTDVSFRLALQPSNPQAHALVDALRGNLNPPPLPSDRSSSATSPSAGASSSTPPPAFYSPIVTVTPQEQKPSGPHIKSFLMNGLQGAQSVKILWEVQSKGTLAGVTGIDIQYQAVPEPNKPPPPDTKPVSAHLNKMDDRLDLRAGVCVLSNLSQGLTYSFVLRVLNDIGSSEWSEPSICTVESFPTSVVSGGPASQ
eukprot:NODE_814_length_1763_cov_16.854142_g668_i0.p1 GENE.NODE_814_length_1763_cov_16.854142_g668_i0~~NODE_814_length_1763_cov_16.854142_g668_i0.p1  ORF type:complete len:574 (+),score=85.29 NODE_814_length_1763_cov_16.854142_g668_i0:146-1723(+)